MARQSLLDRYEPFVVAALLGAHANTLNQGFRQHDVRFLMEIFTNWVDSAVGQSSLPVQNTQISRYMDALVDDGFARKLTRKSYPLYRLSRTGLIELISRLVDQSHFPHPEHFYFVYYIIDAYRIRIIRLVKREGKRFPYSLQAELERLLDLEVMLDKQLEYATREAKKLEKRIEEQMRTHELVTKMLQHDSSFREIVNIVEQRFPYGLNTQKRYSEVFVLGTERQVLWELQVGNVKRAQQIWTPTRRILLLHIEELKKLKEDYIRRVAEKSGRS